MIAKLDSIQLVELCIICDIGEETGGFYYIFKTKLLLGKYVNNSSEYIRDLLLKCLREDALWICTDNSRTKQEIACFDSEAVRTDCFV
jgi:hypothetical protein